MKDLKVGSIVFGPVPAKPVSGQHLGSIHGITTKSDPNVYACNCIGPQPGQTKCPCALRGEAEMGRKMIEDGVTINGQRYRLVPDPQ